MKSNLVDLEVLVMVETDKAYLLNDGDKEAWFPKSQVELDRKGRSADDFATATMPDWLATEKGFV